LAARQRKLLRALLSAGIWPLAHEVKRIVMAHAVAFLEDIFHWRLCFGAFDTIGLRFRIQQLRSYGTYQVALVYLSRFVTF
jgi:hypothetical protein